MKLTDEMHDAFLHSEVGQWLNKLIREEVARGGETAIPLGGSVIQALWAAFMSGAEGKSFREIKTAVSNGTGGFVSGE